MAVVTPRFLRAMSYTRVTTIGITRAKRGQLETAKDPFNFLGPSPRAGHAPLHTVRITHRADFLPSLFFFLSFLIFS